VAPDCQKNEGSRYIHGNAELLQQHYKFTPGDATANLRFMRLCIKQTVYVTRLSTALQDWILLQQIAYALPIAKTHEPSGFFRCDLFEDRFQHPLKIWTDVDRTYSRHIVVI